VGGGGRGGWLAAADENNVALWGGAETGGRDLASWRRGRSCWAHPAGCANQRAPLGPLPQPPSPHPCPSHLGQRVEGQRRVGAEELEDRVLVDGAVGGGGHGKQRDALRREALAAPGLGEAAGPGRGRGRAGASSALADRAQAAGLSAARAQPPRRPPCSPSSKHTSSRCSASSHSSCSSRSRASPNTEVYASSSARAAPRFAPRPRPLPMPLPLPLPPPPPPPSAAALPCRWSVTTSTKGRASGGSTSSRAGAPSSSPLLPLPPPRSWRAKRWRLKRPARRDASRASCAAPGLSCRCCCSGGAPRPPWSRPPRGTAPPGAPRSRCGPPRLAAAATRLCGDSGSWQAPQRRCSAGESMPRAREAREAGRDLERRGVLGRVTNNCNCLAGAGRARPPAARDHGPPPGASAAPAKRAGRAAPRPAPRSPLPARGGLLRNGPTGIAGCYASWL
jgi:hypothetical protein